MMTRITLSSSSSSSSMFGSRRKNNRKKHRRCKLVVLLKIVIVLVGLLGFYYQIYKSNELSERRKFFSNNVVKEKKEEYNNNNNNDATTKTKKEVITIAYVISLIECTDNHKSGQSSIAGLIDASLVLRHSVHRNSIRSKYDYKMYAIVHRQKAYSCAAALENAGFTILLRDPPVRTDEIRGPYLKKSIHREVCCGADEFIKLYAYTILDHPIVIHLDIDFIFVKPMDHIIDAMLLPSKNVTKIRSSIDMEFPDDSWPITSASGEIEAMLTRDYHSSGAAGRNAGFQAGFWILKPSMEHFHALLDIIREGHYIEGFSRQNGWGGLGYGGFVGAMAMQGLIAYYYDVVVPGTTLELNNCRYNAIGAIVTDRKKNCKTGRDYCEDCRKTPIDKIHSIHYTACRKPWSCIAKRTDDPNNTYPRKYSIPVDIVHYDQCMEMLKIWHSVRSDLENQLLYTTLPNKDNHKNSIQSARQGRYNIEYFMGHCSEDQSNGYLRIANGNEDVLQQIPKLYV